MLGNPFILSDISSDITDTADKYIKKVLINAKKRYFRILRKKNMDGVTIFELEKYASNMAYEESGFARIDSEYFLVGGETVTMERSDLTDALLALTPIQLDVLLKSVLLDRSQEEIAQEYSR